MDADSDVATADIAVADVARRPRSARSLPRRTANAVLAAGDLAACLAAAVVGAGRPVPIAVSTVLAAVLWATGAWRPRLSLHVLEDLPWLGMRVAVATMLTFPAAVALGVVLRPADALAVPAAFGLLVAGRTLSCTWIRWARRRRLLVDRTLLIGGGEVANELSAQLLARPEHGMLPVGLVDVPGGRGETPPAGRHDVLDDLFDAARVDSVVVAFGRQREPDLVRIVRAAVARGVTVYVVPRFFELAVGARGPDVEDVWGIPLVRVRQSALRCRAWRVKRVVDVVVSATALVLGAPLLLLLAAAVKVTSPGPVLFKQRRVGQHGDLINVLKLRSLQVNDDSDTRWSVAGDPRLTPIGGFLRRTSLDELPQLVNVLRGEMSLVGPRPERPHFVEEFSRRIPGYDDRHRVPAGMTGWAQIHGLRGDTPIGDRARFDNHYIEHWSLWRDIQIMLRTLLAPGGK